MKRVILLAWVLISTFSQAQVTVDWFNYPGGVSIATDANNNVYTANWDYNPAGDITLTKRDATGNILWNASYNNTDNTRHEVATWVETDNAGNILVSGTIRSGYSSPVNAASLLMKFSPAGNLLWRVVYESSFDGSSTNKCLIDAGNNIYVLGLGTGPVGQVTKVKKFNSSGVSVWNYFDTGGGAPITIKFTPDNNMLLVKRGITSSINTYSKIDLNGNLIWNTSGINSLSVGDAAGDAFGNTFIINGASTGSVLKKLSPAGAAIWSQSNTINGNKVEVGTDNKPVVGGYPAAGYGVVVMKYDTAGNLLWQNLDADGPGLSLLALAPMKLDAANNAYVAGSTMSLMGLCKVNSNGTSAWAATTSSGYPVFFDFGTDNSVYVTGGTTAKFNQSGGSTIPAAPTNLAATAAGTSTINVSWTDNSNNETGFILQRSLSSTGGFADIATLGINSSSYSNTGLTSSTTYYYRVQAINATGSSSYSNVAGATTAAITIPSAPSNLSAIANGCNAIKLSWTDNSNNETSFNLRRSTSLNGTYTTIATLAANTTTYTNTGLTSGQRYYYKIRSTNTAGNSAYSNKANTLATCIAFNPVSSISASPKEQQNIFDITLYPNPVQSSTTLQFYLTDSRYISINIFDMTGRKVMTIPVRQYQTGTNNIAIDLSALQNGIYFVRMDDNINLVKKIVLEK